jgi:hypothetical protein
MTPNSRMPRPNNCVHSQQQAPAAGAARKRAAHSVSLLQQQAPHNMRMTGAQADRLTKATPPVTSAHSSRAPDNLGCYARPSPPPDMPKPIPEKHRAARPLATIFETPLRSQYQEKQLVNHTCSSAILHKPKPTHTPSVHAVMIPLHAHMQMPLSIFCSPREAAGLPAKSLTRCKITGTITRNPYISWKQAVKLQHCADCLTRRTSPHLLAFQKACHAGKLYKEYDALLYVPYMQRHTQILTGRSACSQCSSYSNSAVDLLAGSMLQS